MNNSKFYVIDTENYLSDYEYNNSIDYIFKYIELVHQYLSYSKENMYVQDLKQNKYIIIKGLELINTTFNLLLLYTKNIQLSFYNSQKAYCYYVEFIGQIGDENISFLNLNTKDAILFIHRKIIYNINNDVRKSFKITDEDSNMLMKVKHYCTIYNNLIYKTMDKCEISFQKNGDEKLYHIIKMNTSLINKNIKKDCELIILEKCEFLLDNVFLYNIDIDNIYSILDTFVKKYKKIKSNKTDCELFNIIKKNISTVNFTNSTVVKNINRLLTP